MKTFNLFFIVIGLSIITFSCKKEEEINPSGEVSASPTFLKVGSEWTYDHELIVGLGYDTTKRVVEEQIGEYIYKVRNYSNSDYMPTYTYHMVKDNNFYTSYRLRHEDSYYIECKFGAPVGTKWTADMYLYTMDYEIVAINDTIKTLDQTITDAIKIKATRSADNKTAYTYFSPTVGPLGTGSYEEEPSMRLKTYKIGTTPRDETKRLPAITYNNLGFMKTGNYWKYNNPDGWSYDSVIVEIMEKLSSNDIYKIKLTEYYEEIKAESIQYWYEDNGFLMIYEDGEPQLKADPTFAFGTIAEIGYKWVGYTDKSSFIYEITELDYELETDYFGKVSTTEINVINTSALSAQANYWNLDNGMVYTSGIFDQLIVYESNLKGGKAIKNMMPFIMP